MYGHNKKSKILNSVYIISCVQVVFHRMAMPFATTIQTGEHCQIPSHLEKHQIAVPNSGPREQPDPEAELVDHSRRKSGLDQGRRQIGQSCHCGPRARLGVHQRCS